MEKLLQLLNDPLRVIDVSEIAIKTLTVGEVLVWFLFFIVLCWNYVDTWIKEGHKGQFYNPELLKRTLWISLFLVPFSQAIAYSIPIFGTEIAKYIAMPNEQKNEILKNIFHVIINKNFAFSFFSFGTETLLPLLNFCMLYISVFFLFLMRYFITIFIGIISKYLIVVAPLAAAFSIIPIFKQQFIKLLGVLINASFVVATLAILDHIFYSSLLTGIVDTATVSAGHVDDSLYETIVLVTMLFTMIILYALAVWLTSQYIGSPAASAILTGAAAVGATMTGVAAMKSAVAAKEGAGKGKGIGSSSLNAIKNIAENTGG